jgi:methyl-accepting chemotaxis protein
MNDLSISKRLYALVAALALMAVLQVYLGLSGMANAVRGLETVYLDRTVPLVDLDELRGLHADNLSHLLRGFQHDPQNPTAQLHDHPTSFHTKQVEINLAQIDKIWTAYMATYLTPEEKVLASRYAELYQRYAKDIIKPTLTSLANDDFTPEATFLFLTSFAKIGTETDHALRALMGLQADVAKAEFTAAKADYERNLYIAIAVAVLGIGAALACATWVIRSVVLPLERMRGVITQASSAHDFSTRIGNTKNDEVGQTAQAFDELLNTLSATFGEMNDQVAVLDQSAQTLVISSTHAAANSSEASDSASNMAASVEELSVSVNHIAQSAREASDVSTRSGELATQGGQVIRATTDEIRIVAESVRAGADTIAHLGRESERISDIVQVIREVADQTNLLALNAAIEAARAGEQGRGFAVVADEVRKLAERTSKATGEITAMIGAIQQGARNSVDAMSQAVARVESGVGMAQQAESAIGQITTEAGKVGVVVGDITTALAEQSTTSQSLAQQVERVAQAAEENSAAAGQAASASLALGDIATRMRSSISRFKV